MFSKALCIAFLYLSMMYCGVESYCWGSAVSPDENGQLPTSCEYNEWMFESGASFKAPAPYCEQCTCMGGTLGCCGYGKKAGSAIIPGCTQVQDNSTCDLQFVDSMDESLPCEPWEKKRNLKYE